MLNQFSRTQLLYGKEAMDKLKNSRVAIFSLGGVGGYVGEALVRSRIGSFDLIDDDKICLLIQIVKLLLLMILLENIKLM